jgi:16S rRNA (cytosine967-C5)-methyltransferase
VPETQVTAFFNCGTWVNALHPRAAEIHDRFSSAHELHPLAIRLQQIPHSDVSDGLVYIQDPSTLHACDLLDPQPGERVLDACAAPGGKTTYLAQQMQNSGELIACDAAPERLPRLRENIARLRATNVTVHMQDWLRPSPFEPASFDRVLVDAPCSNTGVLRRRVDVRWRLKPDDFPRMQTLQLAILRAVIPLLKPGGILVYSTCSIEHDENEAVVKAILAEMPEMRCDRSLSILPFERDMDGAFAARFTRA